MRAAAVLGGLVALACGGSPTQSLEDAPAIIAPDTLIGTRTASGVRCVFVAELRGNVRWTGGTIDVHTRYPALPIIRIRLDTVAITGLQTPLGVQAEMPFPFPADLMLDWVRSKSAGSAHHKYYCADGGSLGIGAKNGRSR